MRWLRPIAATAVLALVLGNPAFAQRGGSPGGNRGGGSMGSNHGGGGRDGGGRGPSHGQPGPGNGNRVPARGAPSIADQLGVGAPPTTLPGLNSASLIAPRPGVDLYRARPGTYSNYGGIVPAGPSWGGVPVHPSAPTWGGTPIHGQGRPGDYRGSNYGPRYKYQGGYYGYGYSYPGGYVAAYGAPYGYVTYDSGQPVVEPAAPAQAEIPEGFLRLLVTPRYADVIVDGVLAGTVDDFGGTREQALPAGPHRIRIEAPGYEPVEFDVRVPVGDTISLRRELVPLTAPPRTAQPTAPERGSSGTTPAGAAPVVRKTFYAIPNCYLGNTMPRAESLPAGCSMSDLKVLAQ